MILAEAQSAAQKARGEGDKQALKIISDATAKDAQFYAFYRSLEAYRNALRTEDTTLVLSPNGDFFRYFGSIDGKGGGGGAGPGSGGGGHGVHRKRGTAACMSAADDSVLEES